MQGDGGDHRDDHSEQLAQRAWRTGFARRQRTETIGTEHGGLSGSQCQGRPGWAARQTCSVPSITGRGASPWPVCDNETERGGGHEGLQLIVMRLGRRASGTDKTQNRFAAGWTSPLTEQGEEQAVTPAASWRQRHRPSCLFTSLLHRTIVSKPVLPWACSTRMWSRDPHLAAQQAALQVPSGGRRAPPCTRNVGDRLFQSLPPRSDVRPPQSTVFPALPGQPASPRGGRRLGGHSHHPGSA